MTAPKVTEVGGLYYIHERIDQLVRQTALEIGLIRLHAQIDPGSAPSEQRQSMQETKDRFWAAQDAAADNHNQRHREP
jgi:hypothetical protein